MPGREKLWPEWLIAVPRMVSKGLANGETAGLKALKGTCCGFKKLLQSVGVVLAGFGGLWRVLGSFGEV